MNTVKQKNLLHYKKNKYKHLIINDLILIFGALNQIDWWLLSFMITTIHNIND